jgi:hypothetical protein
MIAVGKLHPKSLPLAYYAEFFTALCARLSLMIFREATQLHAVRLLEK